MTDEIYALFERAAWEIGSAGQTSCLGRTIRMSTGRWGTFVYVVDEARWFRTLQRAVTFCRHEHHGWPPEELDHNHNSSQEKAMSTSTRIITAPEATTAYERINELDEVVSAQLLIALLTGLSVCSRAKVDFIDSACSIFESFGILDEPEEEEAIS
jgi:hypothetical protein